MSKSILKSRFHEKMPVNDAGGLTESSVFIQMVRLCKTYQGPDSDVVVLKDLDLEVEKGQSVAFVGASGVGKSTLLHIVGALDKPTSGTLKIKGRDIFNLDDGSLASFRNTQVGFVFQFHHLLPGFSALENVMMPALISRLDKKDAKKRAEKLLDQVGLLPRANHRSGELSGGEQQRVAIARALVMRPAILLADEPTGNLDERTGEKIHELFVSLNKEMGLTTLIATHNESLAKVLDRRIRLADGRAYE